MEVYWPAAQRTAHSTYRKLRTKHKPADLDQMESAALDWVIGRVRDLTEKGALEQALLSRSCPPLPGFVEKRCEQTAYRQADRHRGLADRLGSHRVWDKWMPEFSAELEKAGNFKALALRSAAPQPLLQQTGAHG